MGTGCSRCGLQRPCTLRNRCRHRIVPTGHRRGSARDVSGQGAMMRVFVLVGLCALAELMVLAGCVGVTNDVDVSHLEPTCARQCTMAYSSCVSALAAGTPSVLFYQ